MLCFCSSCGSVENPVLLHPFKANCSWLQVGGAVSGALQPPLPCCPMAPDSLCRGHGLSMLLADFHGEPKEVPALCLRTNISQKIWVRQVGQ